MSPEGNHEIGIYVFTCGFEDGRRWRLCACLRVDGRGRYEKDNHRTVLWHRGISSDGFIVAGVLTESGANARAYLEGHESRPTQNVLLLL